MAFAIGHISGCHLNPAVSVGLVVGKRFPALELPTYVIPQVVGAIAAAGVLYVIASGKSGFQVSTGFAANGYAQHSPGGYSLVACLVAEVVLTTFFLFIILGSTDRRAPQGFAPIAIGLGLTLMHLVGIPVTNLSVNPARSTGPAVFVGGWVLSQLWLFWRLHRWEERSEEVFTELCLANRRTTRLRRRYRAWLFRRSGLRVQGSDIEASKCVLP